MTPKGYYSYKCLPVGIKTGCSVLARVNGRILDDLEPMEVRVYFHDIVMGNKISKSILRHEDDSGQTQRTADICHQEMRGEFRESCVCERVYGMLLPTYLWIRFVAIL